MTQNVCNKVIKAVHGKTYKARSSFCKKKKYIYLIKIKRM